MEQRQLICDSLEYIDRHFGNKLLLKELSKTAGYSIPQFSRLFAKYTGSPPIRYVNIVRINNAEKMLTKTKSDITQIAFSCGFDSLEVFERNFKKYFGVSASKYRANKQSSPSPFYLSEQIYYKRMRSNMLIDNGNTFDWGRTAELYAKSRNIYPDDFWQSLHALGVGKPNQEILDIGTGTGILPINMKKFGGNYTGVDISPEMIQQAVNNDKNTRYLCADAHDLPFENNTFDVITALQCWVYFDKSRLLPELHRILKQNGNLYIMFMTWLPDEDEIISKTFSVIKKYNPDWSGYMKRTNRDEFHWLSEDFSIEKIFKNDCRIPFTRSEWCDRIIASRGIGATLNAEEIKSFKNELLKMLEMETAEKFTTLHEAVILKLKKE